MTGTQMLSYALYFSSNRSLEIWVGVSWGVFFVLFCFVLWFKNKYKRWQCVQLEWNPASLPDFKGFIMEATAHKWVTNSLIHWSPQVCGMCMPGAKEAMRLSQRRCAFLNLLFSVKDYYLGSLIFCICMRRWTLHKRAGQSNTALPRSSKNDP